MLTPRIHGLDHWRTLNRFTVRHDWREVTTGHLFRVANHTYQLVAIKPKDDRHGRFRALAVIQALSTGRLFTEPLDKLWAGMDNDRLDGLRVSWTPVWIEKAINRHARKLRKQRMAVRKFLVHEGLVVAEKGGAA